MENSCRGEAPLVNRKYCSQFESKKTETDPRVLERWIKRKQIQRLIYGATVNRGEKVPRVCRCGFALDPMVVLNGGAGKVKWTGVETCNSVWACPTCSARIREGRRKELLRGVSYARTKQIKFFMVTLTVPHTVKTPLKKSLPALLNAWRRLRRSQRKVWAEIIGFVRATEIQVGTNGFHPHLHVMVFVPKDSWLDKDSLTYVWNKVWSRSVLREGLAKPSEKIGVVVEEAKDPETVADYLVKKQENKVTLELIRSDLKQGRCNDSEAGKEWHCSPFDLLSDDLELPIGVERRKTLFIEFYEATKNHRCLEWSRGLKRFLHVRERSDEELGEMSEDEILAELRWLRETYRELFKRTPSRLAQAQALFLKGRWEEAQAVAGGELIVKSTHTDTERHDSINDTKRQS